jgi:kynurenine formamidase
MEIIDLTYAFDKNTIYWPGEEGFNLMEQVNETVPEGYHCFVNKFETSEHGGTHMDAPAHLYKVGKTVDEVELEKLYGQAVTVDISTKAVADPDYQLMPEDLIEWEKLNGEIPDRAIIIIKTGFGKYWPDRKKYMGTDERDADTSLKLHFPGMHYTAAEWLINNNKIKAVGIESPGIDYGQSIHMETHITLFKDDIPIFENVANVDKLPVKGYTIIALPIKIKGGSGGPLRIIALIND